MKGRPHRGRPFKPCPSSPTSPSATRPSATKIAVILVFREHHRPRDLKLMLSEVKELFEQMHDFLYDDGRRH